jgi:hypothetical protein
MAISIVGFQILRRYEEYLKVYPSRKAAFRAAKRDANIPMQQHPQEIVTPFSHLGNDYDLDDRNVRLYIFHLLVCGIVIEYHIREDKEAFYGGEAGYQPPHFNAGKEGAKLKEHYYWQDDDPT